MGDIAAENGRISAEVAGIGRRLDDHIANVRDDFAEVKGNIADLKHDVHRDNDEIKQQMTTFVEVSTKQHETFLQTFKEIMKDYPNYQQINLMSEQRNREHADHERRIEGLEANIKAIELKVARWGGGLAVLILLLGFLEALSIHFHW